MLQILLELSYSKSEDIQGYGFITFKSVDVEVMNMVIANREQHAIDGKWIDCKPAEDRRQATDTPRKSAMYFHFVFFLDSSYLCFVLLLLWLCRCLLATSTQLDGISFGLSYMHDLLSR